MVLNIPALTGNDQPNAAGSLACIGKVYHNQDLLSEICWQWMLSTAILNIS